MAEYVSKDVVRQMLGNRYGGFLLELDALPAADVAPVARGRWNDSGQYTFPDGKTAVRCSECGCALTEEEYLMFNWNFCPLCGAKMDGGADNAVD